MLIAVVLAGVGLVAGGGLAVIANRCICRQRSVDVCAGPRPLVSGAATPACRRCGRPARPGVPLTEVVTAVAFGLLAWRVGLSVELLPYLLLAAVGVVVGMVDLRTNRIPNRLLGPGMAAVAVALVAAAGAEGALWPLLRAAIAAAAVWAAFFLMALGGAVGGGDVKLAAGLALVLGWVGWPAVLAGLLLGFVFGAGLGLWFRRRQVRRFPLGPALVAGALVVLIAA